MLEEGSLLAERAQADLARYKFGKPAVTEAVSSGVKTEVGRETARFFVMLVLCEHEGRLEWSFGRSAGGWGARIQMVQDFAYDFGLGNKR